jgi:uncharacterized pyridoxamine 5'-phosphate oxidase family protein
MKNFKLTNLILTALAAVFLAAGCAGAPVASGKKPQTKSLAAFLPVLEKHRNGVLANVNGKTLRTQIITFSFVEGRKAYFCTTSDKPLYEQLLADPRVSYCAFPPDFEPVLSLNGNAVFEEDRALKERALNGNSYSKRHFKTVDNPLLRVFYIDVKEIETYGSEGPNVYLAE